MTDGNTEAAFPSGKMAATHWEGQSVAQELDAVKPEIGQVIDIVVTDEQNRRVVRKIDRSLIPIMGFCYLLQFLDKGALAQSTLLGLLDPETGIHLVGSQFAWCSSIFYFGYLVFSVPSAYLVVRLPIGKYLSSVVVVWGGILMCTAGCTSFTGLMCQRFFLGAAEAAVAPGFSLVTGMFYTRKEQPIRQGGWFIGNSVASILGGLIAYGVGNISNSAVPLWKLLFLIEGAVTVAYGIFMVFTLPNSVSTAWFLNEEERGIALARVLKNKTGVLDNDEFRWPQVWEAIRDPQVWFLTLYTSAVNLPNGALTTFTPLLVKGFGFDNLTSILLQTPIGGCQLLFLFITSGLASYLKDARVLLMKFNVALSLLGIVMVYALSSQAARMTGLIFAANFAVNIPISLSLVTSNISGFTKRSTSSALVFVAYCVGNIAGPQFYISSEAPRYEMGLISSIGGFSFGVMFLTLLFMYYQYENRRRDKVYGPASSVDSEEELADGLSNQTDRAIKSFRYMI